MVKEQVGAGDRLRAVLDATLPPQKKRPAILNIRMAEDEIAALKAEADRREVPVATLARVLLLEALALVSEKS